MNDLQPHETRRSLIGGLVAILSAILIFWFGILAAFYLVMDHQNNPLCHKEALINVQNWLDLERTDFLPNIDGKSGQSLIKLNQFNQERAEDWAAKYQYVPGLRRDDPGDLVLMYFKVPTRYIWHENPQSIFRQRKWLIVPLDFNSGGIGSPVHREIPLIGENAERVSFEEFASRLRKTLQFLRDNNRPNWQTVVAENEAFLESFESAQN